MPLPVTLATRLRLAPANDGFALVVSVVEELAIEMISTIELEALA
jgi:hypothetical protein